jgi:hypothetical protein
MRNALWLGVSYVLRLLAALLDEIFDTASR